MRIGARRPAAGGRARRRPGRGTSSTVAGLLGLVALLLGSLAPVAHAAGEKRVRPLPPEPVPPPAAASEVLPPVPAADSLGVPAGVPAPAPVQPARRKPISNDTLVKFGEPVHIRPDEMVPGDVIVLGGDLRVEGKIEGGAFVVGGTIEIGPWGRVDGEAVALGGRVEQAPGSQVRGGVVGLSILRPAVTGADWQRAQRIEALAGNAIACGLLFLWSALVVLFMRRGFDRARTWNAASPWRTLALGVLALTGGLFTVLMCIVLLAITLVGLPLSLLLAAITIVLLLVALAFGVARIGEVACRVFGWHSPRHIVRVAVGAAVLTLPQVAANLVQLAEWGTGGGLRAFAAALQFVALAAGLGGLVLSRFGRTASVPAVPRLAPSLGPAAATVIAPTA